MIPPLHSLPRPLFGRLFWDSISIAPLTPSYFDHHWLFPHIIISRFVHPHPPSPILLQTVYVVLYIGANLSKSLSYQNQIERGPILLSHQRWKRQKVANIENPRKNKVTTGNSNEITFVVPNFSLQILTWRYINLRPAGYCRRLSSPNIRPGLIRLNAGVYFCYQVIEVRRVDIQRTRVLKCTINLANSHLTPAFAHLLQKPHPPVPPNWIIPYP